MELNLIFDTIHGINFFFCDSGSMYSHSVITFLYSILLMAEGFLYGIHIACTYRRDSQEMMQHVLQRYCLYYYLTDIPLYRSHS